MISEVDIRDWERLNVTEARESLVNLDEAINLAGGNYPFYSIETLSNFITQVELIQKKQVKQIPALFKGE